MGSRLPDYRFARIGASQVIFFVLWCFGASLPLPISFLFFNCVSIKNTNFSRFFFLCFSHWLQFWFLFFSYFRRILLYLDLSRFFVSISPASVQVLLLFDFLRGLSRSVFTHRSWCRRVASLARSHGCFLGCVSRLLFRDSKWSLGSLSSFCE